MVLSAERVTFQINDWVALELQRDKALERLANGDGQLIGRITKLNKRSKTAMCSFLNGKAGNFKFEELFSIPAEYKTYLDPQKLHEEEFELISAEVIDLGHPEQAPSESFGQAQKIIEEVAAPHLISPLEAGDWVRVDRPGWKRGEHQVVKIVNGSYAVRNSASGVEEGFTANELEFSRPNSEQTEAQKSAAQLSSSVVVQEAAEKDSDQWYTPNTSEQPVLDLVTQVLREIGLDPTSDEKKRVPALHYFTKDDDCLTRSWEGLGAVFMNPPFSKPHLFLAKLAAEFELGHIPEAIALVKIGCRSNQKTGELIRNHAAATCDWGARKGVSRIKFIDPATGKPSSGSADFDCCLVYFGPNPDKFEQVFSPWGLVSKVCKIGTITLHQDAVIEVSETMSAEEAQRCIGEINQSANRIRQLLIDLEERQGYKALGFENMSQLMASDYFSRERSTLQKQLAAGRIELTLDVPVGTFPERHCRPLAKLQPQYYRDALERAAEIAGGAAVIVRHVEEAVDKFIEEIPEAAKRKPKPSQLSLDLPPAEADNAQSFMDRLEQRPKGQVLPDCDDDPDRLNPSAVQLGAGALNPAGQILKEFMIGFKHLFPEELEQLIMANALILTEDQLSALERGIQEVRMLRRQSAAA